jgi:hypothetical protein
LEDDDDDDDQEEEEEEQVGDVEADVRPVSVPLAVRAASPAAAGGFGAVEEVVEGEGDADEALWSAVHIVEDPADEVAAYAA